MCINIIFEIAKIVCALRYIFNHIAPICMYMLIYNFQVFYYSTSIFRNAGMSTSGAQYGNLGAGLINFTVTILSTLFIDKFGRKTLLIFSCAVCVCMLTALMISMILTTTVRNNFLIFISCIFNIFNVLVL